MADRGWSSTLRQFELYDMLDMLMVTRCARGDGRRSTLARLWDASDAVRGSCLGETRYLKGSSASAVVRRIYYYAAVLTTVRLYCCIQSVVCDTDYTYL